MTWNAGPCEKAVDATAPVRSKKVPAYAHSLRRGSSGARIAKLPRTFQLPRM